MRLGVSYETILHRIKAEINEAEKKVHNESLFVKHIENIQLLCDLVVASEQPKPTNQIMEKATHPSNSLGDISAAELNIMMGGKRPKKTAVDMEDGEGNGSSIFDF